jgi:plastocyanin domain-containing protein
VEPPPPIEAEINAEGVQEIDLIVTPGGYSPLRFSVKKDLPVRLTFRQLGRVGCGNELNLPYGTNLAGGLKLDDPQDVEVFEFTPTEAGEFTFFCAHLMYKGIMTVRQ